MPASRLSRVAAAVIALTLLLTLLLPELPLRKAVPRPAPAAR
jgi:hypothetical protein